jgi:DNA-binding NtrC family response regulator
VTRPRRAGSETILLVEDDDDVRAVAADALEAEGYRVVTTATADEAWHAATAAGSIDLLLTDIVMPGMTGLDLARLLQTRFTGLRVLLASGYPGEALPATGVDQNGFQFLQKPYTATGLATKIRETLDATLTTAQFVETIAGFPGDCFTSSQS